MVAVMMHDDGGSDHDSDDDRMMMVMVVMIMKMIIKMIKTIITWYVQTSTTGCQKSMFTLLLCRADAPTVTMCHTVTYW